MLHRIKISGYKSFKEVEVRLRPLTVIMGPNTAGKSNFLDALYVLSRAATSRNLREAFDGHRGLPLESFFYGEGGFEELLRSDVRRFTFEADVELSNETVTEVNRLVQIKRQGLEGGNSREFVRERFLRYKLTLEILPTTGHLRVYDEKLVALKSRGDGPKVSRRPFLEKVGTNGGRFHLRMEGQAHPTYHEVGLEHTIVSSPLYEPHYPHIVAFRRELEKWSTYYLEPRTLMRQDVPLAEVSGLGPRGENLPVFLYSLQQKNPAAFENLNLTLQQILPSRPRIKVNLTPDGRVELSIVESGIHFSARLISEGTLRIIGLLTVLHPSSAGVLVGYEEPENGVHPYRLQLIAELLKNAAYQYGKQVIVTTHSPLFAEYFSPTELLECRKPDVSTTLRPFSDLGPLFKRTQIEHALTDWVLRGDLGG